MKSLKSVLVNRVSFSLIVASAAAFSAGCSESKLGIDYLVQAASGSITGEIIPCIGVVDRKTLEVLSTIVCDADIAVTAEELLANGGLIQDTLGVENLDDVLGNQSDYASKVWIAPFIRNGNSLYRSESFSLTGDVLKGKFSLEPSFKIDAESEIQSELADNGLSPN